MRDFYLVCVVGPSGSGKSTLITGSKKEKVLGLIDLHPREYHFSISTASRQPRSGEINGKDYIFTTKESIIKNETEYIEITEFAGNIYALRKSEAMIDGKISVTPIEPVGVQKCLDGALKVNLVAGYEKLKVIVVYLEATEERCKQNMLKSRTLKEVEDRLEGEDIRERWSLFLKENPSFEYINIKDDELTTNIANLVHSKIQKTF